MNFPESEILDLGRIRLEVFQAGEGIPVVLAHGWPELAYSWRYQVPALVEAGYRVIVPNQRGYGRSDKPEEVEAYDIHQLCRDHVALLDYLGIEKAIYVGHDWGAIVVWNMALMHADRMIALANLSVPFTPRPPSDPISFWEKMLGPDFYIVHFNRQPGVATSAFEKNTRVFLTNMYRKNHWRQASDFGDSGRSILQMAEALRPEGEPVMNSDDLEVFVQAFEQGGFVHPCHWYRNFSRNWETTASVRQQIGLPALMIYGEHDMVPKSEAMPDYVNDLEIHQFDCGHWIQQEKPSETNEVLLEWLERRVKPLV
ncbi:MAG: alpha/beta hydrolase [Gammaproteobacteria bacterium]|nr:alpha/beta hydrolase [Gammaproteobacteria bacterium]